MKDCGEPRYVDAAAITFDRRSAERYVVALVATLIAFIPSFCGGSSDEGPVLARHELRWIGLRQVRNDLVVFGSCREWRGSR
jgi:hypothetical protein